MSDNQPQADNFSNQHYPGGHPGSSNPSFPQYASGSEYRSYPHAVPTAPSANSDGGQVSSDERTMAILAHLAAVIAMVVSAGWLTFVGPLIVWFIYKDKSRFVRNAAAGAFNFNLAMSITSVVAWILCFTVILIPLSLIAFAVVFIMTLVCSIKGAVKASNKEFYHYPFGINLLD